MSAVQLLGNDSMAFRGNVTKLPSSGSPLIPEEVLYVSMPNVLQIGRYVHCIWYAVGFPGNFISVVIWNTNHMYNVCSTAHYLITLSICDIVCQFLQIFRYLEIYWGMKYFKTPVFCGLWNILYMIPLYISELLVLGFAVEKLVSIRHPLRSGWFERHQRGPKKIVWILVSVTALSFPHAYFWTVDNRGYCDPHRKIEKLQFQVWHWITNCFIYIFSPICVVVINCIIVQEAKKSVLTTVSYKPGVTPFRQSTIVLLRLSYYRVITMLPSTVIYFLKFLDEFKIQKLPAVYSLDDVNRSDAWQRYINLSSAELYADIITSSRNAISIFIFLISSRHFQIELLRRFWKTVYAFYVCGRSFVARVTHNLRTFQEDTDV